MSKGEEQNLVEILRQTLRGQVPPQDLDDLVCESEDSRNHVFIIPMMDLQDPQACHWRKRLQENTPNILLRLAIETHYALCPACGRDPIEGELLHGLSPEKKETLLSHFREDPRDLDEEAMEWALDPEGALQRRKNETVYEGA